MKKKLIGVLVVVALLAGVPTVQAVAATGDPIQADRMAWAAPTQVSFVPDPIRWVTCWDYILAEGDFPGRCGYLAVPLDYADPAGTRIDIAVTVIDHTSSAGDYQGVLLLNPGGPGGQGTHTPMTSKTVPPEVATTYDWVGFDPRGVALSKPRLTCGSALGHTETPYRTVSADAEPPFRTETPDAEAVWQERARRRADACAQAGGALLDHVRTVDTVNDMDSLRKALGRDQISFFGWSYGTYLGQVYSTMYPTRVRRMVLDSVVDPRRVWYGTIPAQDAALQQAMLIYFTWVAEFHAVYHLGGTQAAVREHFETARAALTRSPAGGTLGVNEWDAVFMSAAYSVGSWENLAELLAGYVQRDDWHPVQDAYDVEISRQDNSQAMYLATVCTDASVPSAWSTWEKDTRARDRTASLFAWSGTWSLAPCRYWSGRAGTPVTVNGARVPGILLIGETFDAPTPFSGALEVRRRYPASSLIEGVDGTTHAGSMNGVWCVDDAVARYLATGALPARLPGNTSDRRCQATPRPSPIL